MKNLTEKDILFWQRGLKKYRNSLKKEIKRIDRVLKINNPRTLEKTFYRGKYKWIN